MCVCVRSASSAYYCHMLMILSYISVSLYEWRNELEMNYVGIVV